MSTAAATHDDHHDHHHAKELPKDRVAQLRSHGGSRESASDDRQDHRHCAAESRDVLALKTPGRGDARNENAQPIRPVGLERGKSQEDQQGNRQHGSAPGHGVDHTGREAAAYQKCPACCVHGDLGKQPPARRASRPRRWTVTPGLATRAGGSNKKGRTGR